MAKNRKKAEEVALKWIKQIDPSGHNAAQLKALFADLSDKQFEAWIKQLEAKETYVPIYIPNNGIAQVTVDNNIEVAERMGVNLFQYITLKDPDTGETYTTPIKYPVLHLPVRRQIETAESKVSTSDDTSVIDSYTNQTVGDSKGSSLSFPEILVLMANGLEHTATELLKARGGDLKAYNQMVKDFNETGGSSLNQLMALGTRAKSTDTLSIFFTVMGLENDL